MPERLTCISASEQVIDVLGRDCVEIDTYRTDVHSYRLTNTHSVHAWHRDYHAYHWIKTVLSAQLTESYFDTHTNLQYGLPAPVQTMTNLVMLKRLWPAWRLGLSPTPATPPCSWSLGMWGAAAATTGSRDLEIRGADSGGCTSLRAVSSTAFSVNPSRCLLLHYCLVRSILIDYLYFSFYQKHRCIMEGQQQRFLRKTWPSVILPPDTPTINKWTRPAPDQLVEDCNLAAK